ncbi:nucleotidyltransferase domain-containing protein, partial [Nanoarchaeota archaeon]
MKKKIDSILQQVLEQVDPPKEELKLINDSVKKFSKDVEKRFKREKIKAEIFIGGSFAKNTVIKKDYYDVDIFLRFDPKYKEQDLSKLTKRVLKGMKGVTTIHGSRDYFRIKIGSAFFLEIVPVLKVKNTKQAENITDLSYSHVRYINRKIKSKQTLSEIRIAKAFCFANGCYGAESYIEGFSGYGLELLVYHYKSFLKFIRAMEKIGKNKVVIDIEKHHKTKKAVLMDVNASKLISPIILIDPTFKQRNALAALSDATFKRFQKACKNFLRRPSIKAFEVQKTDLEKIKTNAKKKKQEFLILEAKTRKQIGDIAGSKLLKFHRHLEFEIKPYFEIKNRGFNYNG